MAEEIKGKNEGLGILIDEKGNKEYLQLSEEGRKELENIEEEFKLDELDKSVTAYTSEINLRKMLFQQLEERGLVDDHIPIIEEYLDAIEQETQKELLKELIIHINSNRITTKGYNNKSSMDFVESLLKHKLNKLNNK